MIDILNFVLSITVITWYYLGWPHGTNVGVAPLHQESDRTRFRPHCAVQADANDCYERELG